MSQPNTEEDALDTILGQLVMPVTAEELHRIRLAKAKIKELYILKSEVEANKASE